MKESRLRYEAEMWEYQNFDWREHQTLDFPKLKKLREETIPGAFMAGASFVMETMQRLLVPLAQDALYDQLELERKQYGDE